MSSKITIKRKRIYKEEDGGVPANHTGAAVANCNCCCANVTRCAIENILGSDTGIISMRPSKSFLNIPDFAFVFLNPLLKFSNFHPLFIIIRGIYKFWIDFYTVSNPFLVNRVFRLEERIMGSITMFFIR